MQDNQFAQAGVTPTYVAATGGTVATVGDFKVHTFTGPGTFCVSNAGAPGGSNTVDYFVVAGGGGAGVTDVAAPTSTSKGAAGGSGIVIIKYRFQN